MAQFSFDTGSVEKRENNYELLPMGWYTAQITNSEIRALNSGNGQGLKLTFDIIDGQHRGRKVWTTLNVRHSKAETEHWALQSLRELMESIGLARLENTIELHNKPLQIKVKVRKDDTGMFGDQNDVAGFKPLAGGAAAPSAGPAARPSAPAPANAPAAGGAPTPPWQKRAA